MCGSRDANRSARSWCERGEAESPQLWRRGFRGAAGQETLVCFKVCMKDGAPAGWRPSPRCSGPGHRGIKVTGSLISERTCAVSLLRRVGIPSLPLLLVVTVFLGKRVSHGGAILPRTRDGHLTPVRPTRLSPQRMQILCGGDSGREMAKAVHSAPPGDAAPSFWFPVSWERMGGLPFQGLLLLFL